MMTDLSRRSMLFGLGSALGSVAFSAMLQAEERRAAGPLAEKPQQLPAKAKHCIFLTMAGGPSHIDTIDPKPKLRELHLQEFQRKSEFASAMSSGKRYYVQSPFEFRQVNDAGLQMCEHFEHLAKLGDELCVYRGLQAESVNHPTALYHLNTGRQFGGDPAIGSWVTYGLGTENQDLPGFVVLPENSFPQGGATNWSNGYMPAHFQATALRASGSPILDLTPPSTTHRAQQRANLDLLAKLNRDHAERYPQHDELSARMSNYELAFRMQMEVPGILDIEKETAATQARYGLDDPLSSDIGRRCLLARRLVEHGVRFVQLYVEGWDSHDYIERAHSRRIRAIDKPVAALISDLRDRGLLDETLVVWCGEFGRSPDNGVRGGGVAYGRDHNAKAMPFWMAGGGCRAGHVIGATDELGDSAVECVHPLRDLHVTLLRLLGLDDNKLTYFHAGRFKQLSQTGGQVIGELIG